MVAAAPSGPGSKLIGIEWTEVREGTAVSGTSLIAIVEDDESVRESIKMLIDSTGLEAQGFGSAEEFMDAGHLAGWSCLILDVMLPGKSGIDLQAQLNDLGFRIPIIFITAHANDRTRKRAIQAGSLGFLEKPFTTEALLNVLHLAMLDMENDDP